MPESFEGRLELAKITQKLDDHIVTQAFNDKSVNDTLTRIETKLDVKANKDEVDKVISIASSKADKEEVSGLSNRLWGLIISLSLITLGFMIWALEQIVSGHFKF